MIIDTHCHLDDIKYDSDLSQVINNARKNEIKGFLIPGADGNDLEKIVSVSEKYDDVFFAIGVHPYHKDTFDKKRLMEFAKHKKCIAVGECGLDYFRLPADENAKIKEKEEQKEIFIEQINIAIELKKPLILHIRDANEDSFNILKKYSSKLTSGAILHCYNASPLLLELAKIGNFYFGIGGVLTFKNAKNLVSILPKIPTDRLLIETDSPYLTPHPYRGERNEPLYTTLVAKKMSEILQIEEGEIKKIVLDNTKRLFKVFNN
ncbi:TatD family hydrolase [Campylobacter pinnipediorum]|uniref:TatD family hydrolase n=1 Tax=Campylobacter pinnipediorum TaxID=1965231 RepID=UPI00084DAA70|nr:TatD family hydrolase [Campylobacter pinnipediorum]AQW83287.1 ssDNA/RNA exonuclease, 3' - 5' specific [Campylobacter pinnipediorum subsp. pinnipediorum]AQW84855.1 ssDNA/RNA exonuclease, 3' - 5' specific [Campylobacter pinnipediorum subsp. pinnipediorum]